MNKLLMFAMLFIATILATQAHARQKDVFPDGTTVSEWFSDTSKVKLETLGRKYVVTDYGVKNDSSIVQTEALQHVIDLCAGQGGGVVVIPKGTFLSGSLFFRQGTNLHIAEGGVLKGSDRIADFPIKETRIEGQTCKYFCALINADGVDGFTMSGKGTINGNGFHYWQEFWIRRQWNPQCTNKDAQRPRLVYISNSQNVTVQDLHLINSPFWTNHVYRSHHVRFIDCYIYAPTEGVKAPSSDAIDLDVCHDVLVSGCYMNVNDDAVVLKGGKGTWADTDPNNGGNESIIIENCHYGRVHGCLTLGSESLHNRNIILRNCHADDANRVIWLKMRPDTPQLYEFVKVENVTGKTGSFLVVRPWTQFFQPEDRPDMPLSRCSNITLKDINMDCNNFFDVGTSDKYQLGTFTFENVKVNDRKEAFDASVFEKCTLRNVIINGKEIKK